MALVRLIAALLLLWPSLAMAQVQQSGTVTPGHPTMWTTNGVVQDAGTSSQGKLTTLGITSSNLQSNCINNGPATGPYNSLCFGINGTQAQITLSNFGGAPAIPLTCLINGSTSNCLTPMGSFLPLSGGTLSGPLILSGDPTLSLGAATKHYVDTSPPFGGPFLSLSGGKLTGLLSLTGPNGSSVNPGLQIYPTLHADGVTSDDAALQAAINSCSSQGGIVVLPPGRILLTGVAGSINLQTCAIVGSGVLANNTTAYGTEIDLTSTTVPPFIIHSGWSIAGVNFYWPNQTGAVVYPPLFEDTASGAGDFYLNNISIINAYDGIVQTAHGGWGRFYITGGSYYAAHDLFRLNDVGDGSVITNITMTPGPWQRRCGGTTCNAYIDIASVNNTILHASSGPEVTLAWTNATAFDWRYGILIDSGGLVGQSDFGIDWDTVGTILDASSGGLYAYQNTMRGTGTSVCGAQFSYVTGLRGPNYYPCFNIWNSALVLLGGNWQSYQDLFRINSGALYLSDAGAQIGLSVNGGGNTYLVKATAASQIYFSNVVAGGHIGDAGVHGITSTISNPFRLTVTGTQFNAFNEDINTLTAETTIIANNWSIQTTGANSVILTDNTYPVYASNNKFDMPSSPPLTQLIQDGNVSGNLLLTAPTGFVDFQNSSIGPPMSGTVSAGTRLRFYAAGTPPDYAFGVTTQNLWFGVPGYSTPSEAMGDGWQFYGNTTNVITLDNSGSIFAVGNIHASGRLLTGSATLASVGATTTLDVPGSVVTAVAINAVGTGYLGTDHLTDGFGGLYSITVGGGGALATIVKVEAGNVSGTPSCTTNCALSGGAGSGATVDLTWTAGTTINIGPTAAADINIGKSGQNTTVVGLLNLPGIVTAANCTGQPSKSIIATTGTGVLLQCP